MVTTHVFLDTEVFDSNNFYFDAPVFRRLAQLVEEGTIIVYLTTITVKEIEFHIVSYIEEGIREIKTLQKERPARMLGLIPNSPFPLITRQFDVESLKRQALDAFHDYLKAVKAKVIPVEGVSIDKVFDKYFSGISPFGSGEKKHEFPDAFAVAGLERWCQERGSKLVVISNDNDMSDACECSESLISFDTPQDFFDALAKEQELYTHAFELYSQHKGEIIELLKESFPDLMLFIDQPESEVFNVEIQSIEIIKELAIELDKDHAAFELETEVEITAEVTYAELIVEDVPVLMQHEAIEKTLYMKATATLLYDGADPDAFQVEGVSFEDDSLLIDIEPSPYDLK